MRLDDNILLFLKKEITFNKFPQSFSWKLSLFGGSVRRGGRGRNIPQSKNSTPLIPLQRACPDFFSGRIPCANSEVDFRKIGFLFFALFLSLNSSAQRWENFQLFGTQGSEVVDLMTPLPNGDYLAAGTFTETINIGDSTFTSQGRQDLWLAKFDGTKMIWAIQGSSPQEDKNSDLKISADGSIYWSGTFFQTGQFGDFTLQPAIGQKSIFILKISTEGEILNGISLSGRGAKDIGEMEFDDASNLYFIGSFTDSIRLADTVFIAKENDIFIAKVDTDFNLMWWQQISSTLTSNGTGVGYLSTGEIIVAGDFEGEMILGIDTISTRTPDEDLFYAKFDGDGNYIFLKSAGGVFPAFCKTVEVDEEDNFYIVGNHRGRITIDENLELETEGQNDNFFFFSLDANGNSRWGKSLGSKLNDGIEGVFISDKEILLAGNYAAEMFIDSTNISFPENLLNNAFFAAFSIDDGSMNWIHTTEGSEFILGKTIIESGEKTFIGGDFFSDIAVDDQVFFSRGFFDFFIGEIIPDGSVSTSEILEQKILFYPNPNSGILSFHESVKNTEVVLYSITGKKIRTFQNQSQVDISSLPAGLYFIKIDSYHHRIIKQ